MFVVYCRPSAIPGPVPDEIVLPATESIGLFQLILMISMPMLFLMQTLNLITLVCYF
jgi:hypothetical protein